jgi:peroxiredoxin
VPTGASAGSAAGRALGCCEGRTPDAYAPVGTRVGNRAPDFTIRAVGGQTIRLSDFIGKKPLVITSTATWCATCIYEAEQFAPVYREVRDRAEFLTVSIDPSDDALAIESFRANLDTPWFYAQAQAPGVPELIRAYELNRFEITYVIDRDGIIRFTDRTITSSATLRAALRDAFDTL